MSVTNIGTANDICTTDHNKTADICATKVEKMNMTSLYDVKRGEDICFINNGVWIKADVKTADGICVTDADMETADDITATHGKSKTIFLLQT